MKKGDAALILDSLTDVIDDACLARFTGRNGEAVVIAARTDLEA